MNRVLVTLFLASLPAVAQQTAKLGAIDALLAGKVRWVATGPLVSAVDPPGDTHFSVKDPTVVRYGGKWHLFTTVRGKNRSHQIEYASFTDWKHAERSTRHALPITNGYFCAPQVFYFKPHKKWYLIYQTVDQSRKPALQPAYSTSGDISNPKAWTAPKLLYSENPKNIKGWIDFWIISDAKKAHLFFTSNDGRMWRAETPKKSFPEGWGEPSVVLQDDIFEASHTYRLKGLNKYLTVVEAQGEAGRRYYKAYVAGRLEDTWEPLAATREKAFAFSGNVRFSSEPWTDSFSHGELLRDGFDETLTVDPAKLMFLFQGVADGDRRGKIYGQIPWKLGLLQPDSE